MNTQTTDTQTSPQGFSADEKKELLTLLNQLKDGGLKYNAVAKATGINYKSFINKVKSLETEVAGETGNNRNRFTQADYEAIKTWWSGYREKMFNA